MGVFSKATYPGLGRWLSADPIGFQGGLNLYSYVGQNPINLIDPGGLDAYLYLTVVRGGTFAGAGHGFLEIEPIPGTGSLWKERTTYGSYPTGVDMGAQSNLTTGKKKAHGDYFTAYAPGTTRQRTWMRLDKSQEKKLQGWINANQGGINGKGRVWSAWYNCADWAIEGWNNVANGDRQVGVPRTFAVLSDAPFGIKTAGIIVGDILGLVLGQNWKFTLPRNLGDQIEPSIPSSPLPDGAGTPW